LGLGNGMEREIEARERGGCGALLDITANTLLQSITIGLCCCDFFFFLLWAFLGWSAMHTPALV